MKRTLFYIGLFCVLTGCAVGPNYLGSSSETHIIDEHWIGTLPHEGKVANVSQWWAQFEDPILTLMIEKAEQNSPTLEVAVARINQARAVLGKASGDALPDVSADASLMRSKIESGAGALYKASLGGSLDASWEIDLFGGKRRSIEKATAELEAQEASWHDARVSLAAEVADTYIGLRACENTLVIMQGRLASQNETRRLVSYKSQAGLTSASDEDLSDASAFNVEDALKSQKGICAQALNQLRYLTSVPHEELRTVLEKRAAMVPHPVSIVIEGLPAGVIDQRPDVVAAERDLAAASAGIGVAEAARYPGFSLSGVIGVNKSSGAGTNTTWSFGPSLSLPVFNGGRLKAETQRARAVFDEALGVYKLAIRGAVKEVEDALSRLNVANSRIVQSEAAVEKYQKYLAAIEASYKSGTASLLDLEDTRRMVYNAEESMITTHKEVAAAWIALYKAVGGGWDKEVINQDDALAAEDSHDKQ